MQQLPAALVSACPPAELNPQLPAGLRRVSFSSASSLLVIPLIMLTAQPILSRPNLLQGARKGLAMSEQESLEGARADRSHERRRHQPLHEHARRKLRPGLRLLGQGDRGQGSRRPTHLGLRRRLLPHAHDRARSHIRRHRRLVYSYNGTHIGEFASLAPTGNTVTGRVIVISQFNDGLVERSLTAFDNASLLAQLGVELPIGAESTN